MRLIQQISIASSPQRLQPIRMLMAQYCLKRCNSNLQDGPTIDPLRVWAMPEAVWSRTMLLGTGKASDLTEGRLG